MGETTSYLMTGFGVVLQPETLLWLMVGVLVGVVLGIMPGLGSITGMVLLFPLAYTLEPVPAIGMLAAVYFGVMYGGSVGAILLNMPGTDQAIPATYDGYPLTLRGRAGPALVMQAVTSFVGGTAGVILVTVLMPFVGLAARNIGPAEFFLIILLALLTLAAMVGKSPLKGVLAVLFGFALATVGTDVVSGQQRFTFGSPELSLGVGFVPIVVGLFAIGEVLYGYYVGRHLKQNWVAGDGGKQAFWPSRFEWRESGTSTLRGSLYGFIVGVIPGAGATLASNATYAIEKSISKYRRRFGKGSMAGLGSQSAADNASSSGSMLPTLAMGIPGSAATAVLLAGFVVVGLRPGVHLMTETPEMGWGIVASMYVANIMLLAVCLLGIPLFARVVRLPYSVIGPVVIVVGAMGSYFAQGTVFALLVMFLAGIAGFFMRRFGYPPAALVMAYVLAPPAELAFRQSMIISEGSLGVFLRSPLSTTLVALVAVVAVLMVASPTLKRLRRPAVRA
jgi:putative tricarboxylic transport membrane protein